MNANSFELSLMLPHDVRLAPAVRALAVHAAQYGGWGQGDAEAFGLRVEDVLRGSLENRSSDAAVPVVLRRDSGPLEVRVDERTITLDV